MKKILPLLVAALSLSIFSGCGGDKKDGFGQKVASSASTAATSNTTVPTAPTTGTGPTTGVTTSPSNSACKTVNEPKLKKDKKYKKPKKKLDDAKLYTATVTTNCGKFEIELDNGVSPNAVASFVALAKADFYNKLIFHRVVVDFVIQGGDPKGTGEGGPGYSVIDKPPSTTKYTRGVVAMAKTDLEDPGTSGSQFFIVTGSDIELPPDYAVIGKVVSGIETVDAIEHLPVQEERPIRPAVIKSIVIKESK